jgi:hypothetical protein
MPHFECGAIDHSATSPGAMMGGFCHPRSGGVLGEDGGPDKARAGKFGLGDAVPRMLRSAVSAFTRVFDALWPFAAWCAAKPGP